MHAIFTYLLFSFAIENIVIPPDFFLIEPMWLVCLRFLTSQYIYVTLIAEYPLTHSFIWHMYFIPPALVAEWIENEKKILIIKIFGSWQRDVNDNAANH